MSATHLLRMTAFAAVGIICTTAAAMAAPAVVLQDTELHTKPASWSSVVDEVYEDEHVDVTKCQAGWCYVKHPGPDGWMRDEYLAPEGYQGQGPGQGPNGKNCTFGVGPNGFTLNCDGNSVTLGGPNPPPPPKPQPPKPNLPYGPDTCKQGYVWRDAIPGDHVCVTPQSRQIAAQENATAGARVDPNGAYGPNSCKQGYVWREAYQGDVVCVTPQRRSIVKQENIDGPSHRVLP